MTAPEILSLKQAGDSVTLRVQSCGPLSIGKYPEVEIVGMDGNRLCAVRIPQKSVDRQFARIDLTYPSAVGKTLTISRDPNTSDPSKPFWGISLAKGATPQATRAQAPAEFGGPIPGLDDLPNEPPPVEEAYQQPTQRTADAVDKLDGLFQLYDVCFDHASSIARKHATLAPDVSAMAATLFIAAKDRGMRV